jgi:endonuclease YncB( thermonuclease family)
MKKLELYTKCLKWKKVTLFFFTFFLNPKVLLTAWLVLLVGQFYRQRPVWEKACLEKVIDGDTISYVKKGSKEPIRGRLWHMDSPELHQGEVGLYAKKVLEKLLSFKDEHTPYCQEIMVWQWHKDIYSRELILVKLMPLDPMSINEQMVSKGAAFVYPQSDWPMEDKSWWINLQKTAKFNNLGLWKVKKSFDYPWVWRRRNRSVALENKL